MKLLWMATVTTILALSAGPAVDAKKNQLKPNMQPFQCDNTESMNVAKFTSSPTTVPLMLETVTHGTTCGYEGGQITGVSGITLEKFMLEIVGTHNKSGFGPYVQVFYNGNQVSTVAIADGHFVENFPPYGVMLVFHPSDFNLPAGAVVNSMRIIANPFAAGDGQCYIRQVHVNSALVSKTRTVIQACP